MELSDDQLQMLQVEAIKDLWSAYAQARVDDGEGNIDIANAFLANFQFATKNAPLPAFLTTDWLIETAIDIGILEEDED